MIDVFVFSLLCRLLGLCGVATGVKLRFISVLKYFFWLFSAFLYKDEMFNPFTTPRKKKRHQFEKLWSESSVLVAQ